MRRDIYISADIEADGPSPGTHSMLSVGFAVAARHDGTTFFPAVPGETTFYRELKPISDRFDPAALAVSGLDRDLLTRTGTEPDDAMSAAAEWIASVSEDHRPVLVAWPLAYDWPFIQWYFLKFGSGTSPFGFSSCLDMKTMFWAQQRTVLDRAGKDDLPASLLPASPHTHNALDDAIEQGQIFVSLYERTSV
ncbi:hypothetical protein OJ998_30070 [Solirubrobacter taibaiensis]|nr:hypothetical protein [Solirubrobacter taibaiensis]